MPVFVFYGEHKTVVKKQRRNFISLSQLGCGPLEFNFNFLSILSNILLQYTEILTCWKAEELSSPYVFW